MLKPRPLRAEWAVRPTMRPIPGVPVGGEIYEGGAKRLARILPRLLLHPLARPVAPRRLSVADTMQDRAGWPRWGRGFGVAGPVAHIVAPCAVPVTYYR